MNLSQFSYSAIVVITGVVLVGLLAVAVVVPVVTSLNASGSVVTTTIATTGTSKFHQNSEVFDRSV